MLGVFFHVYPLLCVCENFIVYCIFLYVKYCNCMDKKKVLMGLCCTMFSCCHPVVVKVTLLTVNIYIFLCFVFHFFLSFTLTFKSCQPLYEMFFLLCWVDHYTATLCCLHNTLPPPTALLCVALLLPSLLPSFPPYFHGSFIQSSHTHSRDYAKPWLAHSKTPTPTKCHCWPDLSHTIAGLEVTHSPHLPPRLFLSCPDPSWRH